MELFGVFLGLHVGQTYLRFGEKQGQGTLCDHYHRDVASHYRAPLNDIIKSAGSTVTQQIFQTFRRGFTVLFVN